MSKCGEPLTPAWRCDAQQTHPGLVGAPPGPRLQEQLAGDLGNKHKAGGPWGGLWHVRTSRLGGCALSSGCRASSQNLRFGERFRETETGQQRGGKAEGREPRRGDANAACAPCVGPSHGQGQGARQDCGGG